MSQQQPDHRPPADGEPARRRPRKQEQEPAADEVTEVAPGVLRCQLPIDMPGLGHVNCYVLEDERGVALVDPGVPGPKNLKVLRARLSSAGVRFDRIHTVLVTHSHPDHFGGAGWIRRETGADIVTHRLFRLLWDRDEPPDLDAEELAALATAGPWDAPPWGGRPHRMRLRHRFWRTGSRHLPRLFRTPRPSVRLADADRIRLAGREWVAVHTPGHTNDHLCLFDPEARVMLSGDHVLPTITPHVGGYESNDDPLQRFFASLDKVAAYGADVDVVLPAHGHPFDDLAGRADEIVEHHRHRLDVVRAASETAGEPMTVPEMSVHLFSPRAQGPLADSETFAHLEHLRHAGLYVRHESPDGLRYEPA